MKNWQYGAPKRAYISGGGSGIGLSLTKALLADGASVALFDLQVSDEVLEQLRDLCNGNQQVIVLLVDITDPLVIEMAIGKAVAKLGAPDFACNCAGILRTAVFTEMSYATFEQVIRVNLLGSRNFSAEVLKHMERGGHLALVASLSGVVGSYTQAAYAASKFGVVGLAEVLRTEQKLLGIDVSVICPGEIQTPLLAYERQHGNPITKTLNEFAGVLCVEDAVAGILAGLRKRQFMITPGFRAKFTRALARKCTGFFHWLVDRNLARAYAQEQKQTRQRAP
ncbi:SDR family NAD(P)-dependent oxidoreductase [Aeromonas enterica]